MSARILLAIAFVTSLMGAGAVISLLIAAILLRWFGVEASGELIGTAIKVGAALCAIGIGFRLIFASWIWAKEKIGGAHG